MHWYNRDKTTLGAYKGPFGRSPSGEWVKGHYIDDIVANLPGPVTNSSQVEDAVTVYRRALAKADDQGITIASIGFVTNIAALLESGPDEASPLNGTDLVAAKVRRVVWMGGWYPPQHPFGHPTYNFNCAAGVYNTSGCAGASAIGVDGMPASVEQIFSDIGDQVYTGGVLTDCAPDSNPCRRAIIDQQGPGNPRCSWDPIVTMAAIRGYPAVHCTEAGQGGRCHVDQNGANTWVTPGVNQSYLVLNPPVDSSRQAVGRAIDELLCKPPASRPSPPVPVPPNATWVRAQGLNCYGARGATGTRHGASDLEMPPSSSCGDMPLDSCFAKCNGLDGCTGVTTTTAGGNEAGSSGAVACFRKSDISLDGCDVGSGFDQWVRGTWAKARGFNCYGARGGNPPHGAKDLEHPPGASCGVMSLEACQAKCRSTVGCDGITVSDAGGGQVNCYRKGSVDLSQCDRGTDFETWKLCEGCSLAD